MRDWLAHYWFRAFRPKRGNTSLPGCDQHGGHSSSSPEPPSGGRDDAVAADSSLHTTPPTTSHTPAMTTPPFPFAADSPPSGATEMRPAAGPPAVPREVASLTGYEDRVAGCLLGKMCGDVLGAAVEGWSPEDVLLANPDGLTSFLHTERGFGRYTDDTQMAIALVRSLLECGGRVDDVHAARAYAAEYHPSRGYGGTAFKILSGIQKAGIDAESIKTIGTKYIPGGSFGNGGAMRIAPLGLVYRHAPPAVLREAVAAALRCTHVHPTAVDGAFVVALAVGYLATRVAGSGSTADIGAAAATAIAADPPQASIDEARSCSGAAPLAARVDAAAASPPLTLAPAASAAASAASAAADPALVTHGSAVVGGSGSGGGGAEGDVATPLGLLDHLLSHGQWLETEELRSKLVAVKGALLEAPPFKDPTQPWSQYFASPGWAAEMGLVHRVSEPFQIRADDAAAVALTALCWHWSVPEDAVVAAVHYGGDTDTVAAITGAMAGTLHGAKWIPPRWFTCLENGPAGRDELLGAATRLAQLDTRT